MKQKMKHVGNMTARDLNLNGRMVKSNIDTAKLRSTNIVMIATNNSVYIWTTAPFKTNISKPFEHLVHFNFVCITPILRGHVDHHVAILGRIEPEGAAERRSHLGVQSFGES